MPRAPYTASRLEGLGGSVFERFLPRIREATTRPVKLHIGDAADFPEHPYALEPGFVDAHPHWHQYPNTAGVSRLRRALADYHTDVHGLPTSPDQILVTTGATNALATIAQALLDPGDEVLVPTPSWPFFRGTVRLAGGVVREVPLYTSAARRDALERIEAAIGPRTAAIYLNTPNNPSARVLEGESLGALLDLARAHDLWVISDEAYDGMAHDGRTTPPLVTGRNDTDRFVSTYTFSKIHRAAGLRLGWIRTEAPLVPTMDRALVHLVYSASTLAQELVLDAVRTRTEWAPRVLEDLGVRRDAFLEAFGLPAEPCEGTYFAFFDASPFLPRHRNLDDLLVECFDAGVLVAPGADFGADYATWLRVCYAGEPLDTVVDAARRLRAVLTR